MAVTYTPLATYTVNTTAVSNIDFQSISGSYTDLVVKATIRSTSSSSTLDEFLYRANANSGNVYDGERLYSDSAGVYAARYQYVNTTYWGPLGYAASAGTVPPLEYSYHQIDWMNYSNATTYKTCLSKTVFATKSSSIITNSYYATTAISNLTFYLALGNFDVGSTITIFGIKAA